jgi:hypothetical protein
LPVLTLLQEKPLEVLGRQIAGQVQRRDRRAIVGVEGDRDRLPACFLDRIDLTCR